MPWEEKAEGGKEMNFEQSNIINQKLFISHLFICALFSQQLVLNFTSHLFWVSGRYGHLIQPPLWVSTHSPNVMPMSCIHREYAMRKLG